MSANSLGGSLLSLDGGAEESGSRDGLDLLLDIGHGLLIGVVVAGGGGEEQTRHELGAGQRAGGSGAGLTLETVVGAGRGIRVGSVLTVLVVVSTPNLLAAEDIEHAHLLGVGVVHVDIHG